MDSKKLNPKKSNPKLPKILLALSLAVVIFSGYKILTNLLDSKSAKKEIEKILTLGEPEEINPEETESEEDSPFLSADLEKLTSENSDTVGWLQVLNTDINYPFVKTSNNSFYLDHSFDKSKNSAGWVFLDYRNSENLEDKNNIIYAHGRTDRTMFGSLKNLLTPSKIEAPESHETSLIRTKTESASEIWEIFSVYKIKTTSDYLKIDFNSDEDFEEFIKTLKSRSEFPFPTEVEKSDKILTLSTCFDENTKVVVHAKLQKVLENS